MKIGVPSFATLNDYDGDNDSIAMYMMIMVLMLLLLLPTKSAQLTYIIIFTVSRTPPDLLRNVLLNFL